MARDANSNVLEVWLDADFLGQPYRVGFLSHDRGQVRFRYDTDWLSNPACFNLDPDLSLDSGTFFPNPELGNFGIFLDSSPDRWGQTLMQRREALTAKDEGRKARTLYAWDYLLGVQDLTRQGALRFRLAGTEEFLDNQLLGAPPVTNLGELESVAYELSSKRIDDLDQLRRWLAVLVAPGASLGGARPKANFRETDGSLWIAKFPARDDARDVGAWEKVAHSLAKRAGIDVPKARLIALGKSHRTFCVQRFDRNDGRRAFFASALTLLRKERSEGSSYLELAQFISTSGAPDFIGRDLEELFRRVAFNIAVGNRDDHLRNHGFILTREGWRLSQAYDVNPNLDKDEHVLCIDDHDPGPNLDTLRQTAAFYRLTANKAGAVVDEVLAAAREWETEARRLGIPGADIQLTARAFDHV